MTSGTEKRYFNVFLFSMGVQVVMMLVHEEKTLLVEKVKAV